MRMILTGATGMIGGLVLRDALRRKEIEQVTSIGRRRAGLTDPRLREVLHDDFSDFRPIMDAFEHQDLAIFCLGAYTGSVSDRELRTITVDYLVAFARILYAKSPQAAFCLLSGMGADPSQRSRVAFARYKGMAESALMTAGFFRLHIFRPAYIYPVRPRQEPNVGYRMMRALYPLIRRIYPNVGIASDDLARAMLDAGIHGTGEHASPVLENRDIRHLAEKSHS